MRSTLTGCVVVFTLAIGIAALLNTRTQSETASKVLNELSEIREVVRRAQRDNNRALAELANLSRRVDSLEESWIRIASNEDSEPAGHMVDPKIEGEGEETWIEAVTSRDLGNGVATIKLLGPDLQPVRLDESQLPTFEEIVERFSIKSIIEQAFVDDQISRGQYERVSEDKVKARVSSTGRQVYVEKQPSGEYFLITATPDHLDELRAEKAEIDRLRKSIGASSVMYVGP